MLTSFHHNFLQAHVLSKWCMLWVSVETGSLLLANPDDSLTRIAIQVRPGFDPE